MAALIINEDVRHAIHEAIAIDGLDFRSTAHFYQISELECRRLYRQAQDEAVKQFSNKAMYVREKADQVCQRVVAQANAAWERSNKPILKHTKDGTEYEEEQFGDSKLLAIQLKATEMQSDLYGAKAPKRLEIETKSTFDVYIDIDSMPREEREKMAEIHKLEEAGVIVIEKEDVEVKKKR